MKNSLKALLGAALVSCVMIGCESTQSRDCDGASCGTAQCDPANCDKESCPKGEECKEGKKAGACGDDCNKACCSDKMACSHENSTFSCPNCKDGEYCCAGCAAKDAAACPDC